MDNIRDFLDEWESESPFMRVKTSGSTGEPKEMLVEKERMLASAKMTNDFLGLKPGDTALLCLPLQYIAGKMMVVRSIERQLKLYESKMLDKPYDLVAMVPSQVHDTIKTPEGRQLFAQCRNVIIGGGAIPEELEKELIEINNRGCFSSYGMTETLSHIALRRIGTPLYTPMAGVKVSTNADGCLCIDAPHLCDTPLVTHDIAEIHEDGFRILGRTDNTICSGGIKIQIEEAERLLQPHIPHPFMITKRPDEKYGEVVVMLTEYEKPEELESICREHLPKYWSPKHYIHVEQLPMTETGKPARKEALRLAINLPQNVTITPKFFANTVQFRRNKYL